ncbi:MAG: RDD family protein [Chitinophagaceae bacterium]|nr:MAG: RDD family protein [Chitinophagaceae bacterium]
METVKVNTSQHIDIDYPVAGLGERIAARLIDIGLFVALFLVLLMVFGLSGVFQFRATLIPLITYAVGFVFYDLLCEIFMNGQSVGKRIMKIKVISLDGAQASIGQYLIRWVFRIVDFTITQWLGALIAVAVTENKQRIGDIVAGTTLIKTTPRTQFQHIAFHPSDEEYTPVLNGVELLTDRDIELIHEVLTTFYKTRNQDLIYQVASKVYLIIGTEAYTKNLNELEFLQTVIKDYNHITSRSV